jgi:hypothetical protein
VAVDTLEIQIIKMDNEKKAGDACQLVGGAAGTLVEQEGGLVCVAKELAPATPEEAGIAPVETPSEEKSEDVKDTEETGSKTGTKKGKTSAE